RCPVKTGFGVQFKMDLVSNFTGFRIILLKEVWTSIMSRPMTFKMKGKNCALNKLKAENKRATIAIKVVIFSINLRFLLFKIHINIRKKL
ncbi:MAG: hypothetical protein ACFFDN_34455, partial [Candidatus Hodarchaeota archaeon]